MRHTWLQKEMLMSSLKLHNKDLMCWGEVYFDFWDNQYRVLHNKEAVDGSSAIYHEEQDWCYYFGTNGKWKSAPLVEFLDHTSYYSYWSGPLQIPDWPIGRHPLITSAPSLSPRIFTCFFSTICLSPSVINKQLAYRFSINIPHTNQTTIQSFWTLWKSIIMDPPYTTDKSLG